MVVLPCFYVFFFFFSFCISLFLSTIILAQNYQKKNDSDVCKHGPTGLYSIIFEDSFVLDDTSVTMEIDYPIRATHRIITTSLLLLLLDSLEFYY